jgi:sugar phosphate isomerase/epimerase
MAAKIDVRHWGLPFRIGTTSYILADDLLPNAAMLAAHVQDMQLVLFEVPGGPTNLPAPPDVAALAALGRARDLTYTVHLLHDLCLNDERGAPSLALAKAQQVIDLTRPLHPRAWVCHLDGREAHPIDDMAAALRQVCTWAGDGQRVAVENLEGFAPDFVTPVVNRTAAGRCVDVGHLWLDGVDPLPHLAAARDRLCVVHLHGLAGGRDHASLAHAAPAPLDAVLRMLMETRFDGVLTLEIFGEEDFWSSLEALAAAVTRVKGAN